MDINFNRGNFNHYHGVEGAAMVAKIRRSDLIKILQREEPRGLLVLDLVNKFFESHPPVIEDLEPLELHNDEELYEKRLSSNSLAVCGRSDLEEVIEHWAWTTIPFFRFQQLARASFYLLYNRKRFIGPVLSARLGKLFNKPKEYFMWLSMMERLRMLEKENILLEEILNEEVDNV